MLLILNFCFVLQIFLSRYVSFNRFGSLERVVVAACFIVFNRAAERGSFVISRF